jgi:hypothetical protein
MIFCTLVEIITSWYYNFGIIYEYKHPFQTEFIFLTSEAEVETRFLPKLFMDLGYPADTAILPKKRIKALKVNNGTRATMKEVDFILTNEDGYARVIFEAKDPSIAISSAWGQAASYALSYNRDKKEHEKVKWLLITNEPCNRLVSYRQ